MCHPPCGFFAAASAVLRKPCGNKHSRDTLNFMVRRDSTGADGEDATRDSSPFEQPGDRIGPYELVAPIGEGGYGTVWQALRRAPYEQRVAIKIVKAGMDSAAVLRRFDAERQTLARMEHPCIARVLDGGLTPRGRPCFVMEFVDGAPITEWCASRATPIRERVALLADAADAIQHAHTKAIIHRDLKPSNVLVGAAADGTPQVKVIDFGIAKALADDDTPGITLTMDGQLLGTAEYMSPEQADPARAREVDTRTDVYALGAIMYELIAGRPPFGKSDGGTRTRLEVLQAVREGAVQPIPADRAPRELGWIAMKAMRFAPNDRYPSAAEFARDLRAWLDGLPVSAAPESAAYRLRAFVRRNKLATAATLAIAGTLLAATAVSVRFAIAERDARVEADLARDEAVAREAEVRKTANFQARVIAGFLPLEVGASVRQQVTNMHAAAVRRIEPDKDKAKDRVMQFFNELMLVSRADLGSAVVDSALLDPITEKLDREFKEQTLARASLLHGLADLRWQIRDLPAARAAIDECLAIRRARLDPKSPDTFIALGLSASIASTDLDLQRAVADGTEACAGMRAIEPSKISREFMLFQEEALAEDLAAAGRPEQALKTIDAVLARTKSLYGDDHVTTGTRRAARGAILLAAGDAAEAEREMLAGLDIRHRYLQPDSPYSIRARAKLADCILALGRAQDALALASECVGQSVSSNGANHDRTIDARLVCARAALAGGKPEEALEQANRARLGARTQFGAAHPRTVLAAEVNVEALVALGQTDAARELIDDLAKAVGNSQRRDERSAAALARMRARLDKSAARPASDSTEVD
ncbi:MAG: Serine/threonine-protein kinase PknB [Planctomycetota bacterium]